MKDSKKGHFRACPVCKKLVNVEQETHTLYDCRNFLLRQFYQEVDPKKRLRLEKMIDKVNLKLGTRSKNLVDT